VVARATERNGEMAHWGRGGSGLFGRLAVGGDTGWCRCRNRFWVAVLGLVALVSCCSSAGAAPPRDAGAAPPRDAVAAPATVGVAGSSCHQVIKIGAVYTTSGAAAASSTGNKGVASSGAALEQEYQALDQDVANYVNAHGGLAGCKVKMVYFNFDYSPTSDFSAESESECVSFAQDQHAFAVISGVLGENKTLISCLAENHVVSLFNTASYQPTPKDFATYRGYLYQPDMTTPYRFGPYIELLAKYGYFGTGAKVGILLADDGSGNNQHLVNKLWKPALAKLGITPVVFTYNTVQDVGSGIAQSAGQLQAAVLKFKAAGVNRVLFTPDGGDGVYLFSAVANSQKYTPRYALTSSSGPGFVPTIPAAQRTGAMAVSDSLLDLGVVSTPQLVGQVAKNEMNANRKVCNAIFSGHIGTAPVSEYYGFCDNFLFLNAALKGTSAVTARTLLAGANRLGASFPLASGYANASFASPDHYDGATAVRVMKWDAAADGWVFVSPPVKIPQS